MERAHSSLVKILNLKLFSRVQKTFLPIKSFSLAKWKKLKTNLKMTVTDDGKDECFDNILARLKNLEAETSQINFLKDEIARLDQGKSLNFIFLAVLLTSSFKGLKLSRAMFYKYSYQLRRPKTENREKAIFLI